MPEGEYSVILKDWNLFANKEEPDINITVKSRQTYYLKFAFKPNVVARKIIALYPERVISLVSQEEALEAIANKNIVLSMPYFPLIETIVPYKPCNYKTYSSQMNYEQLVSEAEQFNVASDRARIYILREKPTIGWFLAGLDSKANIITKGKSYICYDVEPGSHIVTIDHKIDKTYEAGYKIITKGGECYFFDCAMPPKSLRFLSADEGMPLVKKYKLLKKGFLKSTR